jgi:hypothetical protein
MTNKPVMHLLAPMTPLYLRRAGVDRPRHEEERRYPDEIAHDITEPCVLQAVVTVDSKGRVPWPISAEQLGAGVPSIAVVANDLIEVTLRDSPEAPLSVPDGRGRLQLRRGVLEAAGISPGDRLAIVLLDEPSRLVLTSAANLAVRRSKA